MGFLNHKVTADLDPSASYRDLLGTAESIIEMDGQMQQVESYIGGMGMRCNSRLLGKKAANLRAWDSDSKATGTVTTSEWSSVVGSTVAHFDFGR